MVSKMAELLLCAFLMHSAFCSFAATFPGFYLLCKYLDIFLPDVLPLVVYKCPSFSRHCTST